MERDNESSKESSLGHLLPRYFGHGLLFSIFELTMGIVLGPMLVGLIVFGAIIGLIIGFLVLFFIFGAVNSFLIEKIWSIPVDDHWKKLLVHGFVLFIALLMVSIPSVIIIFYSANLPTAMILFVVYCFIDGYVSKVVGTHWEAEGTLDKTDEDSERFLEMGKV
ncbi:MAG: hypothetical protein WCD81_12085 [Candidatus Bathyarchaeia archaeon]